MWSRTLPANTALRHRRIRRLACALALLACCPLVVAHDFWLQPQAYSVAPQAAIPFTLQVGHGPYRQRSPISRRRITRFDAIAPDGNAIDLRQTLQPGSAAGDGSFRLPGNGTYALVLETDDRALSHLPALRLNDYLRAEGLTPALEARRRNGRMNADGLERYSRHTVALVHVGPPDRSSATTIAGTHGMALEIAPERDPYAFPRTAALPVRVFYQGAPLEGALVKLTDLHHDAEPIETHRTDAQGRANFVMPNRGVWLLNVVWTTPLPPSSGADFETFFSSLSFGLDMNDGVAHRGQAERPRGSAPYARLAGGNHTIRRRAIPRSTRVKATRLSSRWRASARPWCRSATRRTTRSPKPRCRTAGRNPGSVSAQRNCTIFLPCRGRCGECHAPSACPRPPGCASMASSIVARRARRCAAINGAVTLPQ